MKIKFKILFNFFISAVLSLIISLFLYFGAIFLLHKCSNKLYMKFINEYNTNVYAMLLFTLSMLLIFIIIMCMIFFKRMDSITDYIEEITEKVNEAAQGDLDIQISKRGNNELSNLSENINNMADSIKKLIARERLWEKQKNNMITNLSHDLRTPLTSILGFLDIIASKKYADEKELDHYSKIALSKSKELEESINQLFEFTKISNGDIKLNLAELDAGELISQSLIGFMPDFEKENMTYEIHAAKEHIKIYADPLFMVRVFNNLTSNCIKYGSSGRKLDIYISETTEGKVQIIFRNYGDMIDAKDIDTLFNRLYRAEKTCEKREGTGLGLAIVKAVVELHNGSIEVTSSKEKTDFIIEIANCKVML